jgi:hypothetical protein
MPEAAAPRKDIYNPFTFHRVLTACLVRGGLVYPPLHTLKREQKALAGTDVFGNTEIMKTRVIRRLKDLILICGLLAWPLVSAGQSNAPTAECTVFHCLNAASPKEKPAVCEVDNGGLIDFAISLKDGPPTLKNPRQDMNPNPVPAKGTYWLVKVIRQKDGMEVPVHCYIVGGSSGDGTFKVSVSMESPESDAVRHAKMETYWKRYKAMAAKEELEELKRRGMTDERCVALFQENLQEHELGMFKIICTYVSTAPGTWNGEVQAPPVTINVLDTGSNLDKILERKAKEQEAR